MVFNFNNILIHLYDFYVCTLIFGMHRKIARVNHHIALETRISRGVYRLHIEVNKWVLVR